MDDVCQTLTLPVDLNSANEILVSLQLAAAAAAAPTLTPENLLTLSRQLADLVRGTATIPIREPRTSPESSNSSQRMSVLDQSSNDSQTSYSSRMNIAASEICDTAENIDEEI
jgi:hypothetical protein